ncbi:MAG: alpha-galactosidase [Clostridia bacterium]|nr:alpha-galactosidase [Clostridia bacterium]
MTTHVLPSDLTLASRLFAFEKNPSEIPLSFYYGDREVHGIPDDFHPSIVRKTLSSDLFAYTVTGINEDGLEICAEQLVYKTFPVYEWVVRLTQRGPKPSPVIDNLKVFNRILRPGCGKPGECLLYHGNGDDSSENGYEWWTDRIEDSIFLAPWGGTSCLGAFPYFRLFYPDAMLNIAVGWTGGWKADFNAGENGLLFSVGQLRSHYRILPGESMRSPRVTFMVASDRNDARLRNMWRRWYLRYILPRERDGKPLGPKCAMHVFMADGYPEFTGATEKNQSEGLDLYLREGLRPDIWWIDAGWYPCDHDWPRTGQWKPDPHRFPNGLGPIGSKCEENGIQMLLWFEPERVRCYENMPEDHLAALHPEWLLHKKGQSDALFDLGNPEARAFLTALIDRLIDENHVHIYRQDFNFLPADIWAENEAEDRIGALENLHIQGYLAYWDALLDHHPGLWIDSCASGGHRNDLDTMRRAVALQYTDVGLGKHPVKQKQHRQMFEWIPYFRAHNLNWDNPSDGSYENGGREIDDYAFQVALAPALTDTVNVHDRPEVFACCRKNHPMWRRAADLELRGDYYPLTECRKDPRDFYAMQFDDPDAKEGFIQIIRNTQTPDPSCKVRPFVRPDEIYTFEEYGTGRTLSMSGAILQRDGFSTELPIRTGRIWFYRSEPQEVDD